MDVILLNGLFDYFPSRTLGPYLLRHRLEKAGHKTQVIDHCQEWTSDEIITFIERFATANTICLGISTTFWHDVEKKFWNNGDGIPPHIFKVINLVKEKYPKIKIVLGGAGIMYINQMLENIDALVIGEAEDIFPELINHWRWNFPEPQGFTHKVNGKKYYNKPNNKTYSVESCDFKFQPHDAILPGETLPMETARGCIFKCKFCAFPHLGKKKFDYIKPLDSIKYQLIENYEQWGVTDYMMMDDTFNDSEYKIDNFLSMSKSLPFELKYTAYIRADLVHRFSGQAEKLQQSGLEGAVFGIESLHPYASQAVGKGWSGRYAKDYVPELTHNIWQDQVNVMLGLIVGLPKERSDSLRDTLTWLNDNELHANWSVLQLQTPESLTSGSTDSVGFLSEFDRNYHEYGYTFDSNGQWYIDGWSQTQATELRKELLYARKISRLSPWLAQTVKVIGYSMADLIDPVMRGKYFMLLPEVLRRKDRFLMSYKKLLLNLPR